MIVMVVSFLIWRDYSESQLKTAIDRITATGEPLFPDDFHTPTIPDDENAALLYEKAAKLIADSGASRSSLINKCLDFPKNNDAFVSTCGALVASHAEALALVREAQSRPGVSWSIQIKSPLIDLGLPELSDVRSLAKLLRIRAKLEHMHNNDGEVVRSLEEIIALSAAVDQQPSLVAHLVALSIEAQALYLIEAIGARLSILDSEDLANDRSADRAKLERLIDGLFDDNSLDAGIVRTLQFERAMQLDVVQLVSSGRGTLSDLLNLQSDSEDPFGVQVPFVALFNLDGVTMLEHMTHQINAMQSGSFPGYREHLDSCPVPPWDRPANRFEKVRHVLSRILVPSLNRAVLLHFRLLSHRRMAATSLAIRLYEFDHGHRPRTLDALAPDYLPAVPADAMSSNGVIQYLLDAEFPRLYSIGSNGIDDGGEYAYKRRGGINWDVLDVPFFLDGPPPPPDEDAGKSQ